MLSAARYGLVLVPLLLAGCSDAPRGERNFEISPASGVVHVDGEPTPRVKIKCYPEGDSSLKYPLTTATDETGRFSFSTYESGDGIPAGTYTLTFEWQKEVSLVAVDAFNGAYADPTTSEHKITIVNGQENDLGTIELSSQGPG